MADNRPSAPFCAVKSPALTILLVAGALLLAAPARAINYGQLDTFENGTSDFWMNGFGDLAVSLGGPGGAGDHFLQIDGGGNPDTPGGKIVGFNINQWTGNFIAANVNAVEMDLKALSIDPGNGISFLTIRIAFRTATGPLISKGASGYISLNSALIPADGLWHHAVFNFSSLQPINSTVDCLAAPAAGHLFDGAGGVPDSSSNRS